MLAAGGIALVVIAYQMAKTSTSSAHFAVFWIGYGLTLTALLARGVRSGQTVVEARLLIAVFAAFSMLPKLLMSWSNPIFFDEYGHLRHAQDMLATGSLTAPNSFLPIVAHYPGLGVVTVGVHTITRLDLWHSGQVVVVLAHVFAALLVAAIARRAGASERVALVAAFVFMLEPGFLFFTSQYAYESLGQTLALLTTYAALSGRRAPTSSSATRWAVFGAISGLACVATHHVSAIFACLLCLIVAATMPSPPDRTGRATTASSWVVAGAMIASTIVWFTVVAGSTGSYLFPRFPTIWLQLRETLGLAPKSNTPGQSASHSLFAGSISPLWEQVCAFLAPVLVFGVIVAALLIARRRRSTDPQSVRGLVPFVIIAVIYLLSLPFSLVSSGNELAHRSWDFTYLGVAIAAASVFAAVAERTPRERPAPRVLGAIALLGVLVVGIGNAAAGQNVFYRFPGPYLFGSDSRSRTTEGVDLAHWLNDRLPANTGVISDRFTNELLTGDSRLRVVSPTQGAVYGIYHDGPKPNDKVRRAVRDGKFDYFVLDKRILTTKPEQSFFQTYTSYDSSINIDALRRLGSTPFAVPVHSTSHYVVYQLNPSE